jgi:hypothetical protein
VTSHWDDRWNDNLEAYRAFVVDHGRHPRRPSSDTAENRLSEWAHEQRRLYRGQRAEPLKPARRAALETVPGWEWSPPRGPSPAHDRWEARRSAVAEFYEAHGRYPRLTSDDAAERQLAGWVKNQVERLPSRSDTLGERRRKAILETPGWPEPRVTAWSMMADALEEFVSAHDRMPIRTLPRAPKQVELAPGERALSMWCANQRRFERSATRARPYPPERRERLERIPGWQWAKPRGGAS